MQRPLCAHGPAIHHRQRFHLEVLVQQLSLRPHVIDMRNVGPAPAAHIGIQLLGLADKLFVNMLNDDEVAGWIQHAFADQPVDVGVLRAMTLDTGSRWNDRQPACRMCIDEFGIRQHAAALQLEVAQFELSDLTHGRIPMRLFSSNCPHSNVPVCVPAACGHSPSGVSMT